MAIQTFPSIDRMRYARRLQARQSQRPDRHDLFGLCPPSPRGRQASGCLVSVRIDLHHANVTEKGEFRGTCAELGFIFVAPDTSPRGEGVPGDPRTPMISVLGARLYVDATQEPYARITACGAM